jgi:ABC-type multidrug transport system ATPase subunit
VVLLDHGKIVATGSPVQLKARHGGERVVVTVDQADDLTSAAEALAKVAAAPPRSTRKASSSPPRQAKRPA